MPTPATTPDVTPEIDQADLPAEAPVRKRYELMVVVSGKVADPEVPAVAAEAKKVFTKHDVTVVDETVWGRLKFAYEIKHEKIGTYLLWHLDVLASRIRDLDAELRTTDHVLRFLLIEAPKHGAVIAAPTQTTGRESRDESHDKRGERSAVKPEAAAPAVLAKEAAAPSSEATIDETLKDILGDQA
ncbi:MAG: 30S ribosomal protein S6 [Candidatus Andersenbacteria bacterium]